MPRPNWNRLDAARNPPFAAVGIPFPDLHAISRLDIDGAFRTRRTKTKLHAFARLRGHKTVIARQKACGMTA